MASLLLHLAAVERLAHDPQDLPASFARALHEDLEYARFGAALADLPRYEGWRGGAELFGNEREPAHFAQLFHTKAPVAMGLKMTELVANGALVGSEAGLAFIAGYFTHFCIDRALAPIVDRLMNRHRRESESERAARRRIEWLQALFYLREQHGRDRVGTSQIRPLLRVVKRQGLPTRGVGRGLFELIRLSAQETVHEAPKKSQVDAWVRGLYFFSVLVSSPLAQPFALPADASMVYWDFYRARELDIAATVEEGLAQTRQVLDKLSALIRRGRFSRRIHEKFLAEFPEEPLAVCAA